MFNFTNNFKNSQLVQVTDVKGQTCTILHRLKKVTLTFSIKHMSMFLLDSLYSTNYIIYIIIIFIIATIIYISMQLSVFIYLATRRQFSAL